MDDFQPIEEHKDFEPQENFNAQEDFQPQEDFSFEKFEAENTDKNDEKFEPQENYNPDFNFEPQNGSEAEGKFEPQENFEPQKDFNAQEDFQPQDSFGEQNSYDENPAAEKSSEENSHDKNSDEEQFEKENTEEDEDIKKFKTHTKIVFAVIALILVGICYLAFFEKGKRTDYSEIIIERKQPSDRLAELKIIPNNSIFKEGERFKFDISRDVFFYGQLEEVVLAFEIPVNIPHRQEIDNLVIVPTPEKIEDRPDGKYAIVRLKKPMGNVQVHIGGFAKVYNYSPEIAQKMGKNIDGKLSVEDKERYTSSEKNIESNDKALRAVSAECIPKATNTLDTVKNIFDFVVENMKYSENDIGRNKGALAAMRSKRGVCLEFANLMVALCRTKDIPARVVYGFDIPFIDAQRLTNFGHAWVEAYIPEYGWVAFDPTNKTPKSIMQKAKEVGISPYEVFSYAFHNRIYLTVDTNEIQMNYKGNGNIECRNLHVKFTNQ